MRKVWILISVLFLIAFPIAAESMSLLGVWTSEDGKTIYEIIDGMKPNRGVVLQISSGLIKDTGTWELKNEKFSMSVGWYSDTVSYIASDKFLYKNSLYNKTESITESGVISIKEDENKFIEKLCSYAWTYGKGDKKAIFRSTFSNDSGVVEIFESDGTFSGFETWAVGSGVLKIGTTTLIESRVSDQYLIGVDDYDRFNVYKLTGKVSEENVTELKKQREEFLAALTTDSWYTSSPYSTKKNYRFRPIESELKGRVIITNSDGTLYSWNVWEYSPRTGAITIGYYEYVAAKLIGDTLTLMDKSGDQLYYRRTENGKNHQFTLGDVTGLALSETNSSKIASLLQGQFQKDDYFYTFDFDDNNLGGMVHKFNSKPFKIVGNKFTNSLIGNVERFWTVEDVVIFDDSNLMKRDSSKTYLQSISDTEATDKQTKTEDANRALLDKNVVLKVRTKDGKTIDIDLPVSDFSQIVGLSFEVE